MHFAGVFVPFNLHDLDPVAEARPENALAKRSPATVALFHEVHLGYPLEVGSVAVFLPSSGSGYAEGWEAVVPQRQRIALAFYENGISRFLDVFEVVQPE